jgi:hypothetical protein
MRIGQSQMVNFIFWCVKYVHTHTHPYQHLKNMVFTVLWTPRVHVDKEVTANWLDLIITTYV